MLANSTPVYLLASSDPALLTALEPVLAADGARVEIHLSVETALFALTAAHAPNLALIDVNLPGMSMGQLLAYARAEAAGRVTGQGVSHSNRSVLWRALPTDKRALYAMGRTAQMASAIRAGR